MSETTDNILAHKIMQVLKQQFPGMNPRIASIQDDSFVYELEEHGNYTYYTVRYSILPSGEVAAGWDSAELAVF